MEKTITTRDLRNTVGEIVNTVRLRGDTYLIEQRGKTEVALVPRYIYENFRNNREKLIGIMETIAERNAGRAEAEIDQDIERAIAEVRLEKGSKSKNS